MKFDLAGRFSWPRFKALFIKEFIQMRRDRATFAMMAGVPLLQLLLFGFAINMDPKALPTAVDIADSGPYARSIVAALQNSSYFRIVAVVRSPAQASELLDRGDVAFSVSIPQDFSRDLVRGTKPQVLIEADATDPAAASNALGALSALATSALRNDLVGTLAAKSGEPPFEMVVHRRYNPEANTAYNIVPGLLAIILTMTMVTITSIAITRERERGTLENLLAMPAHPFEVMLAKIIPFVFVGYIQVCLVLLGARYIFDVPMLGSLLLLFGTVGVFIAANLAVGFTFSTFAQSQLQAVQMSIFFLLPSILLSGFAFPFRGMPDWAQAIGEILPATHFLRVVRGILLKGNGLAEIWPNLWPIFLFLLVAGALAMLRYRRTLD
ncbi:MAG: ABC transporter permease [Alphaproteobacteria bacterium]